MIGNLQLYDDVQAMLGLPHSLQFAIIAAAVRCTPPYMGGLVAPALPGPHVFGSSHVPHSGVVNLLLQALPVRLHSAVVSACCIQLEDANAWRLDTPPSAPCCATSCSAGLCNVGEVLYLPQIGLTQASIDIVADKLAGSNGNVMRHNDNSNGIDGSMQHLPLITSASLSMFDGAVPSNQMLKRAEAISMTSGSCTLAAALQIIAPLTRLTRLTVQGEHVRPEKDTACLMQSTLHPPLCEDTRENEQLYWGSSALPGTDAADAAAGETALSMLRSDGAMASASDSSTAAEDTSKSGTSCAQLPVSKPELQLPHLQHLELYGCNSSDAAFLVSAADPAKVRLLAIVGLHYTCGGLAPRVLHFTGLRALSFALTDGMPRLQVRSCVPTMLLH